jgi:decaprenylphospho-beta-D-erythro-pentofuranosid-2-ulose 2-reductase
MSRRVAILGATRGMGRALSRLMAERGDSLFLLGVDLPDLEKSARDLEIRGGRGTVGCALCDLADPSAFRGALQAAEDTLGGLDTVVVTAGIFATQQALENDPELTARLLHVDFTGTVLFCEQARKQLLARGGGTLCVFSSVAGDRGRKPNVLYGAAKAGLSRYLEGIDHRFHAAGLRTVCVKPGFVRTSMTAGLPEPPFAAEPETVARQVLKAIDRGTPVVYATPIWGPIMMVIRHLPRAVMRRVNF